MCLAESSSSGEEAATYGPNTGLSTVWTGDRSLRNLQDPHPSLLSEY